MSNCDKSNNPVCGCDGMTYPSDCSRQNSKVAKDYDGDCNDGGGCDDCCDSNADCKKPIGSKYDMFCQKEDGMCAGTGMCAISYPICVGLFAPVCGCDGKTYSNECKANANGVSIQSNEPCGDGPDKPKDSEN
jgi:hypothetical protein